MSASTPPRSEYEYAPSTVTQSYRKDTSDGPAFARDAVAWKGHEIRCRTNNAGLVLCAFDGAQRAIGYRQLLFVELQSEEDRTEFLDPVFYGASAGSRNAIARARSLGMVARAWWFKRNDCIAPPGPDQENFAATDHPFAPWYEPYMRDGGRVEV